MDGAISLLTNFPFLVVNTAASDVVLNSDWAVYCCDITHNHCLPVHKCCFGQSTFSLYDLLLIVVITVCSDVIAVLCQSSSHMSLEIMDCR